MPEAFFPGQSMVNMMLDVSAADLASARGELDEALQLLERAVATQDALPYMEPPYWSVLAPLDLARALLAAERYGDAVEVYRADLEVYPNNGWGLFGLAQALEARGDDEAADAVWTEFDEAWRYADVELQVDASGVSFVAGLRD